ncbi:MAG: hypothetical protein K9I94_07730 [Bacteroidales bacterium]|nr:hypothetical protein [Bacteroidales bacterium]
MKKAGFILLIVSFVVASGNLFAQKSPKANKHWASPQVFEVPESVYYDNDRDFIYVSNIKGKPTNKDGEGFISKVAPDGRPVILKWISGLHAPKGMGKINNTLYVSDVDAVVKIDLEKGKIKNRYKAEDAKFLNDIDIDNNGNVYISDMVTGVIYRLQNGKLEKWQSSDKYKKPNGLQVENDYLLVGTEEGIFRIDLETKEEMLYIPNKGGIDGLEVLGNNRYLVSDWKGHVYLLEKGEDRITLIDTANEDINAADIDYVKDQGLILVPTFFNNRITAYYLTED